MSTTASICKSTTCTSDETYALGQRLGQAVESGLVIALYGDLGAGKTTLTQGIAHGMGIAARVTSPTFTLVNEYRGSTTARNLVAPLLVSGAAWCGRSQAAESGGRQLIHIDTYRLGDAPEQAVLEAETFGLDEILAGGDGAEGDGAVIVIEWAERIASRLPPDHLRIDLMHADAGPDVRQIECTAFGPASAAILTAGFPCEEA